MGKLARLLGGSCSVGVGLAVTAAVRRADVRAKDFMMVYSAFASSSLTGSRCCSELRQLAPCYLVCCSSSKQAAAKGEQSERSESMCQLEEEEE